MKRLACLALCLLLCLPLLSGAAAETMDEFAFQCFRRRSVVGGAVVIARNGEILYQYAYGYQDALRKKKASVDTCFRIASVTKMVSAVGLMRLMEEKQISLDTPVSEIVGFPVANPYFPDSPITVRQVMSHTTGLKQSQYYGMEWERLKAGTPYFSRTAAPGTEYQYSNINGGLIGSMIEALSGQSVNSYMRENVFEPLGINAAYHPALLRDSSDLADLLTKQGTLRQRAERALETLDGFDDTCNPRQHTGYTSGRLYISARGLYRLISMLQMGGELDGQRVLRRETVALMMRDQREIPGSSVTGESEYGLCLNRVEGFPGGTWYGHQGRLNGLTSNAYFQPDTGLTVAVIANGHQGLCRRNISIIAWDFMVKAEELIP